MNPYKNKDLRSFLDSISQEDVDENTRLMNEENERVYNEFIEALNMNKCFLCNKQMNSFIVSEPCFHWFTYPNGIKKKHFNNYLTNPISFFRLNSYFRWLANTEKPLGNINDLKEETSANSYMETTIKYKNIEWAFSIGHTDISGHVNSTDGAAPHFHIQMKIDGKIFLKFNDFHIKFTDEDLFTIELLEQASDKFEIRHTYGEGMGIMESEENLKIMDEYMSIAEDDNAALFNRQTLISAPEGQTLSGELIQKAIEESQRTKKPIGKLLQEYIQEANVITVITAGDGVPNMAKRSGKK